MRVGYTYEFMEKETPESFEAIIYKKNPANGNKIRLLLLCPERTTHNN